MKIFLSLFRNFPAIGKMCTKWHIFVRFWLKIRVAREWRFAPKKSAKSTRNEKLLTIFIKYIVL